MSEITPFEFIIEAQIWISIIWSMYDNTSCILALRAQTIASILHNISANIGQFIRNELYEFKEQETPPSCSNYWSLSYANEQELKSHLKKIG